VGDTVKRAKLVGTHIMTCGEMTPEMLEAFAAPWAKETLAIEPSVDIRDRMKLNRINFCLSYDRAVRIFAAANALFWANAGAASWRVRNFFCFLIRQTHGDPISSPFVAGGRGFIFASGER
jgi:hypothetical protein